MKRELIIGIMLAVVCGLDVLMLILLVVLLVN